MKAHQRTPVWLWLNLLSLDAPLVAVVWQSFLASVYPSRLRLAGQLVLALTVWAIYLADRLLDVRSAAASPHTPAHQFYRRYRRQMSWLLVTVLAINVVIGIVWLRQPVVSNGLLVGAGVVAYLAAFPVGQLSNHWKPAVAAILFTAGVFCIAWTETADPGHTLLLPAVAFGLLCLANLLLIGRWEQGKTPRLISFGTLALVLACAVFGGTRWYAAIACSGIGLAALAFSGQRFSHSARRVLADAVLLAPLLLL